MARYVFVTWDGGGNRMPTITIARALAERGHEVRVLGHDSQTDAYRAAGLAFAPFTSAPGFVLDPRPVGLLRLFTDYGLADDTVAQLAAFPADVVVVDCMLLAVLDVLDRMGQRFAVLEHTLHDFLASGSRVLEVVLRPRGVRVRTPRRHATPVLVASVPGFDVPFPWQPALSAAPGEVVYTGAMTRAVSAQPAAPTVVLSLSTFRFPDLVTTWQRVLDAVEGLDVRVVATLGPAMAVGEVRVPHGIEVHEWMPHDELLPNATVLVGHGGHGTTVAALAHGVPVLVLPLDATSDQPRVGRAVARAGVGATMSRRTDAATIRRAIRHALGDDAMRDRARRLGDAIRTLDGPGRAANVLELSADAGR
ncbi:glycosyltransferase family 1 protein [Microbacterium trichothecenolyticum]|uniref:glycosyltransferase n=1 Tax=Microbacterium trichothecenolyticum TaxID=69370 RepID=UPI001C6E5D3D|nr:glycosyltransferase [Microbacterium trichothecenolyticum]MBW9118774.1 glycosyltransferase family 1 protein [Microbacterium trichothecenolyticum]